MIIKQFTAGGYETNNYLVIDEATKQAALIDAGGDFEKTAKLIEENDAQLKYILHTHGHFDHIQGDAQIKKGFNQFGIKIFIHKEDEFLVQALQQQLMLHGMKNVEPVSIDEFLTDGQEIFVGNLKFTVIHTPGHSPGGVCFHVENHLFAGDTLFREEVGRADLPGGNYQVLKNSIQKKLFLLPDQTIVYSGHGITTTIGHEKIHNPYVGANARY